MSGEDIEQTIKNTLKYIDDIGPNIKNEQLARMKQDEYWNDKFLEEEREKTAATKPIRCTTGKVFIRVFI